MTTELTDIAPPTVLAPTAAIRAARKESGFNAVLQKIILHASVGNPQDFISQVYLAGLWHGSELARKQQERTQA